MEKTNDNSKPIIFSSELENSFRVEDRKELSKALHQNRELFISDAFNKLLKNSMTFKAYTICLVIFWFIVVVPNELVSYSIRMTSNIWSSNIIPSIKPLTVDEIITSAWIKWFLSWIVFVLLLLNFHVFWKFLKEQYSHFSKYGNNK